MAVHGGKPKIRHKNMADGIAKNDGCHGGQKKIYIYINSLKLKKNKRTKQKKGKKFLCQEYKVECKLK